MEEDSHHAEQRNTCRLFRPEKLTQTCSDPEKKAGFLGPEEPAQTCSDPEKKAGSPITLGGPEGGLAWLDEDGDGVPLLTPHQGADRHHVGAARDQLPEVKGRLGSREEVGVIGPPSG